MSDGSFTKLELSIRTGHRDCRDRRTRKYHVSLLVWNPALHGQATSWAFRLDTSLGGAVERRGRVPAALTECRVLRNEAQRGQSF